MLWRRRAACCFNLQCSFTGKFLMNSDGITVSSVMSLEKLGFSLLPKDRQECHKRDSGSLCDASGVSDLAALNRPDLGEFQRNDGNSFTIE